ncbi:MAG: hypothetical protein KF760_24260 [Candidatus Eremiobacteraeota bacterium]|nr:hypothetical protein [Candidatus Eremiobacteraeota bacterium]MCW5867492.1 hypothetical protein [Candidatus Eremiobacteraeota bacterium]
MDVSERQAALNTQIRFHNYTAALPLAYALRLELQLMNKRNDRQNEQLERVELTIRQLERLSEPIYQKATRWLWDRFVEKSTEEPLPPIYEEAESPLTVSPDKEDS